VTFRHSHNTFAIFIKDREGISLYISSNTQRSNWCIFFRHSAYFGM